MSASFSSGFALHIPKDDAGGYRKIPINLAGEEPLSIRIDGVPYSIVMRTPGDEIPHAAGFCLTEGIVDAPEDIASLACCDTGDTNVVTLTLTAERREKIAGYLNRRGFISQTSCGLCGKELIQDITAAVSPLTDTTRIRAADAIAFLDQFSDHQPLRKITRATHASMVMDATGAVLSSAEDVGRHNTVDKAVGALFLDHRLHTARVLVLSSRISYELVQKSARADISVILAVSRPTALAVALATRLNITLACLAPDRGLYVYCAGQRLTEV